MNRPITLLFLTLAACASGNSKSNPRLEPAPDETARQIALREADAQRRQFQNVLLKLDQAMESYASALANRGVPRADATAERLEKMIRETVLDKGASAVGASPTPVGYNYDRLQAAAIDGTHPHYQGIALAALGFSGDARVMPTILQGAQLDDPILIDRAVFGLAILRAPDTPSGVLAAIVKNDKLPMSTRTQAAWAIYRLQNVSTRQPEIVRFWRACAGPDCNKIPKGALVQTIRGLGLTRDEANADLVAPYLKSPYALVRMAAADAIARMNSQSHAEDLIALLGPEETVPNVRLHARKALQELAGQGDYGYDVDAWRKAFERK